jgi:hypothetical protein
MNNDIRCWIERAKGRVREVTVEMTHARRKFGLVVAPVKDSDLMPKRVKPSDYVRSSERCASKNQYAHS